MKKEKSGLTVIVPARAGSKRLKNKNFKDFLGRPLVFHSLDAVIGSPHIEHIIFSSDSDQYCSAVANEFGSAVQCVLRPPAYAEDSCKVTDEVARLINVGLVNTAWFMLCLPTAPLFGRKLVADFTTEWMRSPRPMFTCNEYDFPPTFAFTIQETKWKALLPDTSPMTTGNTRSQDIETYFRPNGAAYIHRSQSFLARKILYDQAEPYVIPKMAGLDVDDEVGFAFAEMVGERFNAQ